MTEQPPNSVLSDEDVEKIARALEARLARRFHVNIGKGVWNLAWRGILWGLLILAVYGATHGAWPKF